MKLASNNMMLKWVKEKKEKGEDEPYKLDLILKKSVNPKGNISYMNSLGKKDDGAN